MRAHTPTVRRAAGVLMMLLGLGSCREQEPSRASAVDSSALPDAVRKPDGLAAEIFVDRPAATWTKLRALAPAERALPVHYGALLGPLLAVSQEAAAALKEEEPASAVVLAGAEEPELVIALPIRNGNELVSALTTGRSARYGSARDAASRIAILRKLQASPAGREPVLGVRGDVLLLAPSERALSQAGAYVASTVARRAARPVGLVASLGEGGA
ncbi:MAG TPA: hypothetical protein VI072_20385, partial [Polyangiaceae bacterium]